MRRILGVLLPIALIVAACGGDSDPATTTEAAGGSEQTTSPPETTTTITDADVGTDFAITEVNFETGMVTVTNVGSETGNLEGHALCQRPSYLTLPDTELAPGESAQFSSGGLGGLDPDNGEVGLYSSGSFSSAADILSYVEWGRSGHGRSSVAVEAGIWPDASFVITGPDSIAIIAPEPPATDPDGWFIEAGD